MKFEKWILIALLGLPAPPSTLASVKRGEVNGDGVLDISDAVAALGFLFTGGRAPVCLDAADSNHDGIFDISDAVFTLSFLFSGGPQPPAATPRCEVNCGAPPFETPVYSRSPDDSIAFESLLEGAGYGASTNSSWVDIAAGNVCGGPEKELILLKNRHSFFSILGGPTPYALAGLDLDSNPAHPWRAVAAGNLDADPFDEIVAVRHITTANVPDVFVYKIGPLPCDVPSLAATTTIGNSGTPIGSTPLWGTLTAVGTRSPSSKPSTSTASSSSSPGPRSRSRSRPT